MLLRSCWRPTTQQFAGDLLHAEGFDHVADFDVAVARDADAAFHAVAYFANVILEAAQGANTAFEDLYVVAQQADFGVAFDGAILDVTPGDGSHFGNTEGFANLGASKIGLLEHRFEQAGHGLANFVLQLVDDRVQANFHVLLLSQLLRLALRTNVEANDDRVRSRGQKHVA